MQKKYDEAIKSHYERVALSEGAAPTSTMADLVTRKIETQAILDLVSDVVRKKRAQQQLSGPVSICDVGCGNGYTLEQLVSAFPDLVCVGIEMTDALRQIASERIAKLANKNARVVSGDIRNHSFSNGLQFDIIICQRVIINLLDLKDQRGALANIVSAVKPGGILLFIEAFSSSLANLNLARAEFDLSEIPPAEHNLYLPDDFFSHPELKTYQSEGWSYPANTLSTHYYVSRVMHPAMLGARPFVRNSEFAKFLSAALPMGVGDYSQLRINAFERISA